MAKAEITEKLMLQEDISEEVKKLREIGMQRSVI